MKIKFFILSLILSVVALGFWSCSDDDSDGNGSPELACSDFEHEWAEVTDALEVYTENPSVENCESYKSAIVNFYSEFQECPFWGPTYQSVIDEVQEMDCSQN